MRGFSRGKRKDNGKWVEGYYAKATYYLDDKDIHVIIPADVTVYPGCEFSSYEEVIPETVGQCTDLTDKNGKEIYEGDIIRAISKDYVGDVFVGVVVLEAGSYQIKNDTRYDRFHRIGEISKWQDMGAGGTMTYTYEVIGNIHDNHELLKGGVSDA